MSQQDLINTEIELLQKRIASLESINETLWKNLIDLSIRVTNFFETLSREELSHLDCLKLFSTKFKQ